MILTLYHKQKGTSNKFCPRNISISMILILYHKQKGTSNKFCPRNIFILMIPFTIINKKKQAINFVLEMFSFL